MKDRVGGVLTDLSARERSRVLLALDMLTRPMSAREIEHALRKTDLRYRELRAVTSVLKNLNIVAVVDR
jgi:hypothetical protein